MGTFDSKRECAKWFIKKGIPKSTKVESIRKAIKKILKIIMVMK